MIGDHCQESGTTRKKRPEWDILEGAYTLIVGTETHTTSMINLLHISEKLTEAGTVDITVSREDFKSAWKMVREDTSSSISGIHFSNYKSETTSYLLSNTHTLFTHIVAQTRKPLILWLKGVQVMILKEAGNLKV